MGIHPIVRSLVKEIDEFRARTGMSVTAFGTQAVNDGGLIPDLVSGGRHPSIKTMDRIRAFMEREDAA